MIHGVHTHGVEQEGVTIRRRSRDDSRADVSRRTGAIFDDHWLPKCSIQMFGHDARQNVS